MPACVCDVFIYLMLVNILADSRDTTVKLWDTSNAAEVRSMGGHTGSVTCVKILTPEQAHVVCK